MGKLKAIMEPQLFETISLLDKDSVFLLGNLFLNNVFLVTAPRLAERLAEVFKIELLRRENHFKRSPKSLALDDWPDSEIGDALDGCLLLRRACILPMQEEFTDLLTALVSAHAVFRLKLKA